MFLTNPKADSGDRSAWGGFFFNPVPTRIGAANITPDTALQLTAVYACVRVHANAVSTLPFQMYREKPNGAKEQIRDHWLYRLFAKRPNAYQNPMEFRAMMHGHLELRGNAFAYIVSNRKGEATDLHPIHPDRITIELLADLPDGGPNWRYRVRNRDGSEVIIARTDMFHIKGLSSDGIVGYNPIALARKMLATGAAAQDYGVRFFDNDASPTSGIIEHPTNFKDKEQRNLFRETWQEQQSGANKGKVAVLEYGLKYVPPPVVSNADAQFIETKKMNRSEIASLFEVPPHMIGDLDRSTNNNIEHQGIEYVTNKLRPRVVCWEEAIKYTFLDPDDEIVVRMPFMELMRGDMAARTEYINTGVMNGTLTRNEGRIMEDRDPLPGLDEPLMMVNMIPVSQQQDEADEEEQAEKAAPPVPAKAPPQNAERLNALAVAAAERVARKETQVLLAALKDGDWPMAVSEALNKHSPFVAQALGVSEQQATHYIRARWNDPISAGSEESDIYNAALARLTKLALEGTV
jgi:HK97 family phage portal protein